MRFIFDFFGHRRLAVLAVVLFASAILDLFGVVVLLPFIKVATEPGPVIEKYHLRHFLEVAHIGNEHQFVVAAGLALIAVYTLKTAVVYLLSRYQFKATARLTYRLTEGMYARLLRCRYGAFQQFPASQLIGTVYNHPIHATLCMTALATIVNDVLFIGMLLIFSIAINPLATGITVAGLLVIGGLMQVTVVDRTHEYGKQQARYEDSKHKLAYATITAIKDIKVMGIEKRIQEENSALSEQFFLTNWKFGLLNSLPKTIIEYCVLLGLCVGILVFVGMKQDATILIPVVGVGIAAVLRVLPSFTRIINSLNQFKFSRPIVERIVDFYERTDTFEVNVADRPMPFAHALECKNLGFSYGDKVVLSNVSISIPKGQSIGIVGMSGSGKSTLLDLISGIQEKATGEFLLDGQEVDPFRTNAIRRMLGYVPQTIALVDESVAFNIAFAHVWDAERMHNALKVANLLEFVNQLPERERTLVGENGVRLSGGQRQRIGIARALYKDPEILIFDEATSAVDNITEQELTKEIRGLAGTKTLILVAHRLSTIQHCDRIYVIHEGKNVGEGTYQELLSGNELFQEMNRQQPGGQMSNASVA
jgi:ABC-type multidrug transport system fused ATPase/permease subunit